MSNIVIKNNRCVFQIYDMDSFLELPLKNVRKLWKLMFAESWRNEESIENLKQWLLNAHDRLGMEVEVKGWELAHAVQCAEEARRIKESYGSAVTKEINEAAREALKNAKTAERLHKQSGRDYEKCVKLQALFQALTPV